MLCNILHRYLQQADYSIIEEATMVGAPPFSLVLPQVAIIKPALSLLDNCHRLNVTPLFNGPEALASLS